MTLVVPDLADVGSGAGRLFSTARRSRRGLEKKLAEGGGADTRVIYEGPQSEVDRLAASYGLQVVQRLAGGAVLAGQNLAIEALARDGGWAR